MHGAPARAIRPKPHRQIWRAANGLVTGPVTSPLAARHICLWLSSFFASGRSSHSPALHLLSDKHGMHSYFLTQHNIIPCACCRLMPTHASMVLIWFVILNVWVLFQSLTSSVKRAKKWEQCADGNNSNNVLDVSSSSQLNIFLQYFSHSTTSN